MINKKEIGGASESEARFIKYNFEESKPKLVNKP